MEVEDELRDIPFDLNMGEACVMVMVARIERIRQRSDWERRMMGSKKLEGREEINASVCMEEV